MRRISDRNTNTSSSLSWGDTRNPEAANRRVTVTNISSRCTVDHLLQFFGGKEVVEGVTIIPNQKPKAFIQLRSPHDYHKAIAKDSETFQGRCIQVRQYYKLHKAKPSKPRSRTPERQVIHRRVRERTRSRSRSPSRGRSPDPPRQARGSQQDEPAGWTEAEYDNYLTHRTQIGLQEAQSNYQAAQSKMSQPNFPNIRQPGPSAIVPFSGNLPSDIELTLKLVLEHKTARSLSLIQIQNVINYLEQEKIGIRNNETIPVVPTQPQYMHIPRTIDYRHEPIDPALKKKPDVEELEQPEPVKIDPPCAPKAELDPYESIPEGLSDSLRLLTDAISFH